MITLFENKFSNAFLTKPITAVSEGRKLRGYFRDIVEVDLVLTDC
jgi:hypothetical protein